MKAICSCFIVLCFLTTNSQVDFQPSQIIAMKSKPKVVSIKDVNNDKKNDVVTATAYNYDTIFGSKLYVFIQNDTGGLDTPIIYSFPRFEVECITIDDVNNDSLNDIIIGFKDSIGIFFQNKTRMLNPIRTFFSGTKVNGVKCGDINNDGLQDIAVSHWLTNNIRVFYQVGTGFTSQTYIKPIGGFDEIDVADINKDGLDDIVFMSGQGKTGIYIYYQNQSGTLKDYQSYFLSSQYASLTFNGIGIGDLNNDCFPDIVASLGGNKPSANIAIWIHNSTADSLDSPKVISAYDIPDPIEVGDLNRDGRSEIITAHSGWLSLSVYEQNDLGIYDTFKRFSIPYLSHYNPYSLSIGDINQDGKMDVAIASDYSGLVVLYNKSSSKRIGIISTLAKFDTIERKSYKDSSLYITINKTLYQTGIIKYDTFKTICNYQDDSVKYDSFFYKNLKICNFQYIDTIYETGKFRKMLKLCDTTLISKNLNSLNSQEYNKRGFKIYPNPSAGILTFEKLKTENINCLSLQIYDICGKLVMNNTLTNLGDKIPLNLTSLEDGFYTLKLIINEYHVYDEKISIMH